MQHLVFFFPHTGAKETHPYDPSVILGKQPGRREQNMTLAEPIREKLFRIVQRPARYKTHSAVLVPRELTPFAPDEIFRSEASFHVLELGSGWGEFALTWLADHPDHEYLALEVKGDRVHRTLKGMDRAGLDRLRILPVNFNWFLEELLPEHAFDLIVVNFPDPWPKRRHWKHRLVQTGFPERMARFLRPGGRIHLATDYSPYARRMLHIMRNSPLFEPVFPAPHYVRDRPEGYPPTRFEEMQREQGYRPWFQQWRLL